MESRHKDVIRAGFTRQAPAYAANPTVSDPERVARLVNAVSPAPSARVLDVATGPGYVALGFAACCREVVGVDLTDAPLRIADQRRTALGLSNLRFQTGDAEHLPFDDTQFDVVVCRLAMHHVEEPDRVVAEMVRVCRPNGKVAVEDLVVSEHASRAEYHNHFERLRDPSHARALSLSELLRLLARRGLEIENVRIDAAEQDAERWLENAQTPPDRAEEVRQMLARDAEDDLSGVGTSSRGGRLFFTHHSAIVVGRRLRVAPDGQSM